MSRIMSERLGEWRTWYLENKLRLGLYYIDIPWDVNTQRLAFLTQLHVGMLELLGIAIDDLRQGWLLREGGVVPQALIDQIGRCVYWYKQNMATAKTPEKQWQFLLEGQGQLLALAQAINAEIDHVNQGTIAVLYKQAEDVLPGRIKLVNE